MMEHPRFIKVNILFESEHTAQWRDMGLNMSFDTIQIYINPNLVASVEPAVDNEDVSVVFFLSGEFVVCPHKPWEMVKILSGVYGE